MIDSLLLKNFKCFQSLHLPLGGLTLLTGLNGMGKSSIQQALLLLRQSWLQGLLGKGKLALNGDLLRLGTAADVLNSDADDDVISLGVSSSGRELLLSFGYDAAADVLELRADQSPPTASELGGVSLFSDGFQYLNAERLGPRTSFPTSEHGVRNLRQLGNQGEYASHFLAHFGSEPVRHRALLHPNALTTTLAGQVEAWMGEISPGTRLKLTPHPAMDVVQLQYQFDAESDVSAPYRPTNVGFGLTYTLPILVATLAALPGSLLLLENPEAHLHPRGQFKMGELLARAAAAGLQVIVETHSDHVLNGLRLAVHDGLVSEKAIALRYFSRRGGTQRVDSPTIDADGRVDHWPEGFFDEWDAALDRLLAPRKGS